MIAFFTRFRELAFREMRSVVVPAGNPVPAGKYGLLEFYCDETGCDCRRVILRVVSTRTRDKVWATINYGWERPAFYVRWCHGNPAGREMAGATLEPSGPQTEHSQAFLELFRTVVLRDRSYVERLKRHYRLFKEAARDDRLAAAGFEAAAGGPGRAGASGRDGAGRRGDSPAAGPPLRGGSGRGAPAADERTCVLRIRPRCDPAVWRTIEFAAAQTLHDVHCAIQDAFGLDDDHPYTFHLPGAPGGRHVEYGGSRTRTRRKARRARLGRLPLPPGCSFLYLFDFGDELWHEIEVLRRRPEDPATDYPVFLEERGLAPAQYLPGLPAVAREATGEEARRLRLVDELARLRQALHGSPREARDLLHRLAGTVQGLAERLPDGAGLDEIEARHAPDIRWWLAETPTDLAREGLVDEAIAVAERLAAVERAPAFLADRAVILARAGRYDEAEAGAEELLERFPGDSGAVLAAGQAFEAGGRLEEAEELYRRVETVADAAGGAPEGSRRKHDEGTLCAACLAAAEAARGEALGRLASLLERQGRRREASEVRRRRQALLRPPDGEMTDAPPAGTAPSRRRIGRNEPCPCGSGRKFKRCCGLTGRPPAPGTTIH